LTLHSSRRTGLPQMVQGTVLTHSDALAFAL
jgi:hypothetical protein